MVYPEGTHPTGPAGAHWLAGRPQLPQHQDGAALGQKAARAPGTGLQPGALRPEVNTEGLPSDLQYSLCFVLERS